MILLLQPSTSPVFSSASILCFTCLSHRVCETAGEDWEGVLEIDRNNSNLQDAGTANQALTAEDIARLRSEGKSGDEIIAALTENSATFQNKTQYSQVSLIAHGMGPYVYLDWLEA